MKKVAARRAAGAAHVPAKAAPCLGLGWAVERPDDEASLIRAARSGDDRAFVTLYQRHRTQALYVARKVLASHNRSYADDVVQTCFDAVRQALLRGHGPTGPFRAYLLLAVRREAARIQIRLDRELSTDDAATVWGSLAPAGRAGAVDPAELVGAGVARGRGLVDTDTPIGAAFDALNPRFQTVLWLSAIEGRDTRQIASELGLSANAAAALAYRARTSLREAYGRSPR